MTFPKVRSKKAAWTPIKSLGEAAKLYPQFNNAEVHPDASSLYDLVNTLDVAQVVESAGWIPHAAGAVGDKFGFHGIKFRHPEFTTSDGNMIQLVMTNSHNRTETLRFMLNFWRQVCSNGMRMPVEEAFYSKRHISFNKASIFEEIEYEMAEAGKVAQVIEAMSSINTHKDMREMLAIEALTLRHDDDTVATIDLDNFLAPKRKADRGNNGWLVFNRAQESLIKGLYEFESERNGEVVMRKARAIVGTKADLTLNEDLFNVALDVMGIDLASL